MKKLLSLILSLALILGAVSFTATTASAASGTWGGLSWTIDSRGILNISGTGEMDAFTSSSTSAWLSYKSSIKSVFINEGVTSVSAYAFYGCTSLTSAIIGDSVTSIGNYAFSGCKSLTSVTIPDSVTSIGNYAFDYCTSLTSITIPNSVTSIGNYVFYNCTFLTSVTIPDSVTSIGLSAFYYCTSLDAVYISDLAAWCNIDFSGSSSNPLWYAHNLYLNGTLVTDLVIPDSVTSIGRSAFEYCKSLTSVTIPDSVTSIGGYAFEFCTSLTSITIPDSVTSIGDYAFNGCSSLTSVTIGGGVTSIGSSAFYNCTSLDAVYISDLAAWCNINFSDSSSNPLRYAHNLYLNGTLVTDLVIPDSVASIGDFAFRNCTSLTSVTIKGSVTSIGDYAFDSCKSLKSVTIPDSVTSIGDSVFASCTSLTSVTIPDSVTSIGSSTFSSCTSLTSVTIPDSVTSIGSSAFDGCTAIEKVNYCGNEIQWMQMYIDTGNDPLINAPVVYNYQVYVPFTFTEGADTANVAIDDTKGHLSFSAGGMTVENIKALFADENISFTKASGDAQTSGNVGTGTVITASRGDESKSYTIVVLGDLTGDGKVSTADYSKAVSAVKGKAALDSAFYAAANVVAPGTDKLAANDYAKIKSFIVNKIESF